jgi:hypothetical protein
MRLYGIAGLDRAARPRLARAGLILASALFLQAAGPGWRERPAAQAAAPAVRAVEEQTGQYNISAHLFIIGNLGDVGSMTIESALRPNSGRLEKRLRMAGSTNAGQVRKNRDYHGEFNVLKLLPLMPDGSVDTEAVKEWRNFDSSSSGYLKLNKKFQSERLTFFRGRAVATREDGTEKTIDGDYGSILAPLEYLMENDIRAGDVIEAPFILNGVPRVFVLQVSGPVTLSAYKTRAYQVDIWAYEKANGVDRAPKDVWRKKGNVRVWFCKEGPYRNQLLRMKIKFRWYLWLFFDLQK